MGVHKNVAPTEGRFPKQTDQVGGRTKVCFNYDTSRLIMGTIMRDDLEDPYLTIIQLDDGPLVLGTECQYTPPERAHA